MAMYLYIELVKKIEDAVNELTYNQKETMGQKIDNIIDSIKKNLQNNPTN